MNRKLPSDVGATLRRLTIADYSTASAALASSWRVELTAAFDLGEDLLLYHGLDRSVALGIARARSLDRELDRDIARDLAGHLDIDLDRALALVTGSAGDLARALDRDLDRAMALDLAGELDLRPANEQALAKFARVNLSQAEVRQLSTSNGNLGVTYLVLLTIQWWRWIVVAWAISVETDTDAVRKRPEHIDTQHAQALVRAIEEPIQQLDKLANAEATPDIESDLLKSKIQQIQTWQHDPHPNPQVYELHIKDIVTEISKRLKPGSAIADLLRSQYGVDTDVANEIGQRFDTSYEHWTRLGDDDPTVSGEALAESEKEQLEADGRIRSTSPVLAREVEEYEESLKAVAARRAGKEAGIEVVEMATQAGIRATVRLLMDKLPDWKAAGLNLISKAGELLQLLTQSADR